MIPAVGRVVKRIRASTLAFRLEDALLGRLAERDPDRARRLTAPPANAALKSEAEIEAARALLRRLGLRHRFDHPTKVWDGVRFFSFLLHRVAPSEAVLDFGCGVHANVLRWLEIYGYRRLWAVDTLFRRPVRRGAIRYSGDDVHRTRFADGSFAAAVCQSVVEHGVDLPRFFAEARRVIRPGGFLLLSTDYWPEKVDTAGETMYGLPWTIFSRPELESRIRAEGFGLLGELDGSVGEPVLRLRDRRYTFIFLAFQRSTAPTGTR